MATPYDVIVIGGGASGMMAAGRAAERGRRVLLLEKNYRLGKKLAITGGGRCNICNAEHDEQLLLSHYGPAKKFLHSAFAQFGMNETVHFFTQRGLPLKTEARNRMFPVSEQASDVVKVLEDYLATGQVTVQTGTAVQRFVQRGGSITGVQTTDGVLSAASYVLATGGTSHPETGSTGDGFHWLRDLGLSVVAPTPAVVPLAIADSWVRQLAGLAIDNVKLTFFVDGVKAIKTQGRILCTHFGLSGPTILNIAAKVATLLPEGEVQVQLDVFPDEDVGALDKRITAIFDENKNRDLKNVLKVIAPTGMAHAILPLWPKIDPEKKVHSITQAERKLIGRTLKALPATVTGLMGLDRAVVVDGGLSIAEVEGKTMRTRRYPNLFITGDVLHINRPSGGYSLQLCWTTGWVAGSNA